jgi:predicted PP-loop superfamily ATPase
LKIVKIKGKLKFYKHLRDNKKEELKKLGITRDFVSKHFEDITPTKKNNYLDSITK